MTMLLYLGFGGRDWRRLALMSSLVKRVVAAVLLLKPAVLVSVQTQQWTLCVALKQTCLYKHSGMDGWPTERESRLRGG